jgi:Zn-dependent peptidase ImmA (M78 family)
MATYIKSLRELFAQITADGNIRHLLRNFNFGIGGRGEIPSAKALAEEMGFEVYLTELPANIRGRLTPDPFSQNGYKIEVNKNDDVVTRRWTVLHEIMHFLLHRNDDPFAPTLNRAGRGHFYDAHQRQEEREANEAVEAVVFGDGALNAAVSLYGRDESLLAKRFGVSGRTLRIALAKI